ncbi:transglutaminase TgpA family protein [Sporolactobacillus sp. KGMB 08714]|uniref:transglutaminase TgpA family protein n=1 Tax=Sporolactobacillus sp. KGMB 08714 TaxID=3064704 RepID=UPI002FBD8D40
METAAKKSLTAVLYLLGSIILWECARPVTELTVLQSEPIILAFIAVTMLLSYLRLPGWLQAAGNGLMLLYSLHYFFFSNQALLSAEWIRQAARNIYQNFGILWQGRLVNLSDLFSTLIFFVLLWLIGQVLQHWIRAGRFFLFFFLALALLCALNTFTFYDARRSIVIVAVSGLMILGIQELMRVQESGVKPGGKKLYSAWFLTIGMTVVLVLAAGLAGPKPAAQWPSPSSLFQKISVPVLSKNGSFFSAGQRIGYDEDDSSLGGSLAMDTTVLFTASSGGSNDYWKVAVKDVYSGKGWKSSGDSYASLSGSYGRFSILNPYEGNTAVSEETATLTFTNESPAILPYSGQPTAVQVQGGRLKLDQETGQIQSSSGKKAKTERISYLQPTFRIDRLRQVQNGEDPLSVREKDLQLPNSLPGRVRSLARGITASQNNRYDKVMAVVNYLKSSRFSYSTDRVPRPTGNQDYVDQFLFRSKIGYCDNFSTAMAVLLRSVGIPARWVKGFSSGTYVGQTTETIGGKKVPRYVSEITNANAHSWVEVYFPGSGWVAFEPTPSFSGPDKFSSVSSGKEPSSSSAAQGKGMQNKLPAQTQKAAQPNRQQKTEPQSKPAPQSNRSLNATGKAAASSGNQNGPAVDWGMVGRIFIGVAAAGLLLALITWRRWLTAFYVRKQRRIKIRDRDSFNRAYKNLFRLLRLKGLDRSDTQTLREFAETVDRRFSGNGMLQLTKYYERFIYGNQDTVSERQSTLLDGLCAAIVEKMNPAANSAGRPQ